MRERQIYVGDYVRMKDIYLKEWTCENPSRLRNLQDTIFLVTESFRCYSWSQGIGGGGMLLTLKPFAGPLAKEDISLGRGEASVDILDPAFVDQFVYQDIGEF